MEQQNKGQILSHDAIFYWWIKQHCVLSVVMLMQHEQTMVLDQLPNKKAIQFPPQSTCMVKFSQPIENLI